MLIEVRRDILDQAINDANSSTNDAAVFLSEVALAVKRGKHIVYVPALNGDIDLSTNLWGLMLTSLLDYYNLSMYSCV